MSLIPAPKEVLAMGKIEKDPDTGKPVFPENATPEQIKAYYEWEKKVQLARENMVQIF